MLKSAWACFKSHNILSLQRGEKWEQIGKEDGHLSGKASYCSNPLLASFQNKRCAKLLLLKNFVWICGFYQLICHIQISPKNCMILVSLRGWTRMLATLKFQLPMPMLLLNKDCQLWKQKKQKQKQKVLKTIFSPKNNRIYINNLSRGWRHEGKHFYFLSKSGLVFFYF